MDNQNSDGNWLNEIKDEILELILVIETEFQKIEGSHSSEKNLDKIMRAMHFVKNALNSMGIKSLCTFFEKLEIYVGLVILNAEKINLNFHSTILEGLMICKVALINGLDAEKRDLAMTRLTAQIDNWITQLNSRKRHHLRLDIDLQEEYISDSKNQLHRIDENLRLLSVTKEKQSTNEIIADLFRDFHTFKSASSMFGYKPIEELVHELENLLFLVKNGELNFEDSLELIFSNSVRQVKLAINELETNTQPTNNTIEKLSELIGGTRRIFLRTLPSA